MLVFNWFGIVSITHLSAFVNTKIPVPLNAQGTVLCAQGTVCVLLYQLPLTRCQRQHIEWRKPYTDFAVQKYRAAGISIQDVRRYKSLTGLSIFPYGIDMCLRTRYVCYANKLLRNIGHSMVLSFTAAFYAKAPRSSLDDRGVQIISDIQIRNRRYPRCRRPGCPFLPAA